MIYQRTVYATVALLCPAAKDVSEACVGGCWALFPTAVVTLLHCAPALRCCCCAPKTQRIAHTFLLAVSGVKYAKNCLDCSQLLPDVHHKKTI